MNKEYMHNELLKTLKEHRDKIKKIYIHNYVDSSIHNHVNSSVYELIKTPELDAFILKLEQGVALKKACEFVSFFVYNICDSEDLCVRFEFNFKYKTLMARIFTGDTWKGKTVYNGIDILKKDVHDSVKRFIIDNMIFIEG